MTLEQLQRTTRLMQTRGIAESCRTTAAFMYLQECLQQFFAGNYGTVPAEDTEANNNELAAGCGRIVARYAAAAGLREDIYIIAYFDKDELESTDCNYTIIEYVGEY